MKKLYYFMAAFIFLLCNAASAQQTIKGKVTDQATGEPLKGVTVLADKSKAGVPTKDDGTYTIIVNAASTSLTFSYVGYASQSIAIGGRKTIDLKMTASLADMADVVVIGYGTQKRSSVTGAVAKYKNDQMNETPSSRLDQALQGKIAGVAIQNVSSEAGSEPKVRIRGLSSIGASSAPFVVVDGQPSDGLAFVNMADVESVEVLKDAASAAIYGSRGANGVILITTKSGKADKPKYSLKFSIGEKDAYKLYPMMTVTEYTKMLFDEAALKATDPSITPPTGNAIASSPERAAYVIEQTIMGGVPTDWQASALRKAQVMNIQLGASGGTKTVKYYFSGGYQKDQGMMYHSEYERFNIKGKIDAQLGKKVKLTFNVNPSYIKRERPSTNFIDFVRFQSYLPIYLNEATAAFVRQSPLYPDVKAGDFAQARYFNGRVYTGLMPDGSNWVNTTAIDPFSTANNTPKSAMETRTITTNDYRLLTSGELTINILPGLDFKTLASSYVIFSNGLDFTKRNSARAGDVNKGVYMNSNTIDLLSENTLTYAKTINDHSFTVLAGYTAEKNRTKIDQVTGLDYPSDNVTTLNTALTVDNDRENTYNNRFTWGLLSYLGRVTYAYKGKYLLNASLRADGSSYFGEGHRWGTFPAISLGWSAGKEKFFSNVKWMSDLKFRGSYGALGNNRIVGNAPYDLLYSANYPTGAANGTSALGQVSGRDLGANPLITWERTFSYNGGLDVSLFKSAVTFSLDVYQSKTEKLLLRQSTLAFTGITQFNNNIGKIQNDGIELEVTTNNIRKKNFKWSTSANISHVKNKVLQLGDEALLLNQGERTELYMNKPGAPLIQYFGYKTDGVWLSQADITAAQAKGLTSTLSNVFVPGGLKLVDLNGDNKIDVNDRTVIGNPYPDFTWGITNNITYKGFDVSFMFQGSQGGKLVNGDPNYNETKRYNRNYNANRWLSPKFPGDGKTPYSTVGFNWMLTDYVVEDASYYSLREVLVGYTLPTKWIQKVHMGSMRFYFSAQNLFYHFGSNYRGINPEARFNTGPYNTPLVDGYQRGSFPLNRTFLFGVDVNF